MRFTVKLTTPSGEVLHRDLEADHEAGARAMVMAEGFFPLEVKRAEGAMLRRRTVKMESLILFNQELLALLRAGIPLLQALELLVGHGKDAHLRTALEQTVVGVKEGLSFSDALEKTGGFPAVYLSNVVAGERSGALVEVLARWLGFQQFSQQSRRKIVEALFYPGFLVVVLVIALLLMFNVVLPRFAEFYQSGDAEMPAITAVLLSIGKGFRATLWLQGLVALGLVFLGRWMVVTEQGRRTMEKGLLSIPKVGHLVRQYQGSVFCRTLGVLLAGGLPAVPALEVVQRTSPSEGLKRSLVDVIDAVRAGQSLHLALDQSGAMDPLAVEMIRVWEQSGALPDMLTHVANFFDQEVEKATAAVTSLIGPALIVFMGAVVLTLLLAIYIPLFNAGNVVR